MSSSRSDWPAMPAFHPEFGLLCPSRRSRRGMRLVMLSIVTTMAIGATMGLAVARWPDDAGLTATAEPTDGQPPARGPESCKAAAAELTAFFFNSACEPSKLHARHGARAVNRVATVIIGRMEAAPATPVVVAAIEPSRITAGVTAGIAENSPNLVTPPVERPAPALKKPKAKRVAKSGAPIALDAGMVNAYAATPRLGREPFDPYHDASRSSALQSSFGAPFGRFR